MRTLVVVGMMICYAITSPIIEDLEVSIPRLIVTLTQFFSIQSLHLI